MNGWPQGRWPLFPNPREDELFSSWIARLAISNGTKVSWLLNCTGLLSKGVSQRSIDNIVSKSAFMCLTKKTGISEPRLWGTTVTEYYQHFSIRPIKRPQHLLLLGLARCKSERYFLQFCPLCLQNDTYYRRLWRMSCIVACPIHGIALHDRCPDCSNPINIFGNDEKHKGNAYDGSLSRCSICGTDHKEAPIEPVAKVLKDFSRLISVSIDASQVEMPDGRWLYLGSYLNLIRQLAHAFLKVQNSYYKGMINDLDVLPLSVRRAIIENVSEALHSMPASFLRVCKRLSVTPYMLKTMERKNGPNDFWFEENCLLPLSRKLKVVTRNEIASAIELMRLKGLTVNCYSVSRFMGLNKAPVVHRFFKDSLNKN